VRTADLIAVFGSAKALATFLGVSKSAISQWGDSVPELREYKIREKRPAIDDEIAAVQRPSRKRSTVTTRAKE
jgi:DNA-binding transcriptional regulator YdaS (Cro superfamily)